MSTSERQNVVKVHVFLIYMEVNKNKNKNKRCHFQKREEWRCSCGSRSRVDFRESRIVWPPINGSAFLEITKTLIDKNVHFFGSLRKGCLFSPHPFALAYISVFDSHANTVRAARFLCRDVREESLYSSLMANWKRCQFSI